MNKKIIISTIATIATITAGHFIYEHLTWVSTENAQLQAHTTMLSPKVSGFITKVNIKEGQEVKKNDVLVVIDARDYQNALSIAQGELASAQAALDDAQKNFNRLQTLYKQRAVSQQQFDSAQKVAEEAKARFQSATAHLAQSELNLLNTKIIAPNDGFIAKKAVEVGQLANSGVPLIGFVESGERWVTANFKETDIEDIKVGGEVEIEVDAISSRHFKGKVESLSAATGATFSLLPPDNATGNFTKVVQRIPVKIMFEDLSKQDIKLLRAGLSAFVKVRRHK